MTPNLRQEESKMTQSIWLIVEDDKKVWQWVHEDDELVWLNFVTNQNYDVIVQDW